MSTALTIRYAGGTAYGAITVVSTLSQLMPYADLGIGAGVMTAVSTTRARSVDRMSAIASAVRLLLIPAAVVSLVALLGVSVFSWSEVLGIASADMPGLDAVTAIALLSFALGIPLGIGQRVLVGMSRNPMAVGLSSIAPVVSLVFTLVVVTSGAQVAFLALAPGTGVLASSLVCVVVAFSVSGFRPTFIFTPRRFRRTGLLSQGIAYLVLIASLAIAFQLGRVVLAQTSTLQIVAAYSLMMQLYLPIWSFFSVGGIALWPIFARMRSDSREGQSKIVGKMAVTFGGAAIGASVGIVSLGAWVGTLLSDGEIELSLPLLASCSLFLIIQAIQFVYGMALTDAVDLRFQALWAVPMALTVVAGVWVTSGAWGAPAPFLWAACGVLFFQVVPNALRVRWNERPARKRS